MRLWWFINGIANDICQHSATNQEIFVTAGRVCLQDKNCSWCGDEATGHTVSFIVGYTLSTTDLYLNRLLLSFWYFKRSAITFVMIISV